MRELFTIKLGVDPIVSLGQEICFHVGVLENALLDIPFYSTFEFYYSKKNVY
ncbi:MAG: hypothetical protein ACTJHT_05325 [Sphingobacterium sp.]|uniref:hypothetical protein n=1 Tax=Sphingobacterium sp. JB170 TaxID=1434842 RepID=UPI00097EDEC8|nr:hypothetical protein [Sphingobacterium sp. JB170]SJN49532.1 hypothetical protein FM107_18870 [Sphingobacterium sp. JB170]